MTCKSEDDGKGIVGQKETKTAVQVRDQSIDIGLAGGRALKGFLYLRGKIALRTYGIIA